MRKYLSKYKKDDGDTDEIHMPLIQADDLIAYSNSEEFYASRQEISQLESSKIDVPLHDFTISDDIIYNFFKKSRFFIGIVCILVYVYLLVMLVQPIKKIPVNHHSYVNGMKEFLVWSDQCKIPNLDPYDPNIITYIKRYKYESCSTKKLLTSIRYDSTIKEYILSINKNRKIYYDSSLNCCYQDILRNGKGNQADFTIKLSECLSFNNSVQISNTTDNILVKCTINQKQVYIHGHPMMPDRADIRERLDDWNNKDTKRAPSILMIGIDSISRVNLIREMPKTAQILYNNGWFEMSGYNKIDENTYPNLMAILAGYNLTNALKICDNLDNCPLIWKLFREHGYVTAYAEDEVRMSTFNIKDRGFKMPPVDYYLKPFMLAAERNFKIHSKSGLTFCLGYQHSADYVFDYAIELATRYKNYPFFGLFWANTFSHHDVSDCSSMDSKVVEYLEKLSNTGILNESVVIFFSDHGMRYGPIRKSLSGYFEERLPFMFIWLPQWLKTMYPEYVTGLFVNKNRLTNPYDIHMTLKNLLELSGRTSKNLPKATDCPSCQSLFKPVPYNRSCQDIAITDHWCTCYPYHSIDIKSELNNKLALFVVDRINDYIKNFENGSISNFCDILQLHFIVAVYRANITDNNSYPKNLRLYRVLLRTLPGSALFEATIRHKIDTKELQVSGKISRLDAYATDSSNCILDNSAALYCHCRKILPKL